MRIALNMDIDCGSISAFLVASEPANVDCGKQLKLVTTINEGVPANLMLWSCVCVFGVCLFLFLVKWCSTAALCGYAAFEPTCILYIIVHFPLHLTSLYDSIQAHCPYKYVLTAPINLSKLCCIGRKPYPNSKGFSARAGSAQ